MGYALSIDTIFTKKYHLLLNLNFLGGEHRKGARSLASIPPRSLLPSLDTSLLLRFLAKRAQHMQVRNLDKIMEARASKEQAICRKRAEVGTWYDKGDVI